MSKKQKTLFWLVALGITLGCTVLALAVGRTKKPKAAPVSEKAFDQLTLVRGPIQNIRFTLYDAGMYPREARAKSGRLIISLVDYTAAAAGLVVERDRVRQNVGQTTRSGVRWRSHQELDLGPGTYRVYDASLPENQATLIVEP